MCKLSVLIILASLVLAPFPVFSAFKGAENMGGYYGPMSGAMADTVASAMQQQDEAPVVLTGNIISQVAGRKHRYIFRDNTGEIMIDIDKKAFRGQNITPQDTVRISGRVDRDFGKELEIDVKQIDTITQ